MSRTPRRLLAIACSLLGLPLAVGCAALPRSNAGSQTLELRDIAYRGAGPDALRLDVRLPEGPMPRGQRPAILVLHPGGWTSGSKEHMRGAAETLARAGFVVVVPEYRLAPKHRFPAQLEDVRDAVRWVRRNATELGIDPLRIGAFGYSAGAHLAALLATHPAEGAQIQAVAVGGTPADLLALPPNGRTRALFGAAASEAPGRYSDASPPTHVSADDPPFSILHGRFDWIIDIGQARALRDALRERGVPTAYRESWLGHFAIFLFQDGGAASSIDFFDRWLRRSDALAAVPEPAIDTARWPAPRPLAMRPATEAE